MLAPKKGSTAVATHLVKSPPEFTLAFKVAKPNDIITLGRGVVIPATGLPNLEVDPKTPVVITSESETDLGTLEGVCLQDGGTGNFTNISGGTKFGGLVFDTIELTAPKIKVVRLPNGDTYTLKKAVGWRCDATTKGAGTGEHAAMQGFRVGAGCHDIIFRNITARGFAKQWSIAPNVRDIRWEYIDNIEHCEDCYIVWGGTGLTWRFCRQADFDGLDAEDAQKGFGWKNAEPPHADNRQFAGRASKVLIEDCTMNDKTARVHGELMNDPSKSGGKIYKDFIIRRNRYDMSHTTAFYGGNCDNFEYSGNKFSRIAETGPADKNDTCARFLNLGGKVDISNNVGRKLQPWGGADKSKWNWVDNVETNDASVVSKGYVERRKGIAKPSEAAGCQAGESADQVLEAIKAKAAIGSKWTATRADDGVVRTVTGYSLAATGDETEEWTVEYIASGSPDVPRSRTATDFFVLYKPIPG
jgi:hypothetical protein